jgi:asparagine synthase (glutamine-hydrolysing)
MLALEQRYYLADHNLMYTDKMSMAAGVEVRVPFLDLQLVEFSAFIPDRYRLHAGEAKWILKKAMEPYLPKNIIYRPKTGFGVPLRRWIRNELREMLQDYLLSTTQRQRGIFNLPALEGLIAANDTGQADAAYSLFSILCNEIWFRNFIDGSVSPARADLFAI